MKTSEEECVKPSKYHLSDSSTLAHIDAADRKTWVDLARKSKSPPRFVRHGMTGQGLPSSRRGQASDDSFSEEEATRRAEEALKRMLQTPHKPHKPIGKKGKSPEKPGRKREPSKRSRKV